MPTMYIRNVLEVALQEFSSLSESGFIPTIALQCARNPEGFSSLSESGFIPTFVGSSRVPVEQTGVLISFREWLHSYYEKFSVPVISWSKFSSLSESGFIPTDNGVMIRRTSWGFVLISFREWLHSYPMIN